MLDFSYLFLCMSLAPPPCLIIVRDTYIYYFLRPKLHLATQSALIHPHHQSPCILCIRKTNAELPHTSQHHRACAESLCWALTLHLFCSSSSGLRVLLPDSKTKGNTQKIFNGTSWVTSATQITLCVFQIPVFQIWSSHPFAGREAGFYSRENWVSS